ncbi:MFS transporter [Nocardioides aquiterrae]|uniref:MFS transporter n=1 Tax=Nocardioides aquiterrae TaxID=203799 RepID=A0ABN1U986_9ACTN
MVPAFSAAQVVVVVVYASVVAGVTLPTPMYVDFQQRWSLTHAEVTALYALYPVGVLVVLLGAAHWSDDIGRRPVMAIALGCSAGSSVLFLVADSFVVASIARVLTGVASGFMVNAANAALVELAPSGHRRSASILSTAVNQIGLGLGALAAALLVQYGPAPTRLTFACHLGAMLLAAALSFTVPETVAARRTRPRLRLQPLGLPPGRRAEFLGASFAAFAAFALCGLLASLAPSIVREQLGSDHALLGGGAGALVFVVSGATQPFWARRRDTGALLVGSGLLVSGLVVMTYGLSAGSVSLFLTGVAIGGAAVGALFMTTLMRVNLLVGDASRARTTGTYLFITFSGLILPTLGTGFAADRLTQLQATVLFSTLTGLVTLGSLGLLLMGEHRRSARVDLSRR